MLVNRGGQSFQITQNHSGCFGYSFSMRSPKGDTGFTKHVYFFKDKQDWRYFLINYQGNESVFVPRPHGVKC